MKTSEAPNDHGFFLSAVNRLFSMAHIETISIVVFVVCMAVFAFSGSHLNVIVRSFVIALGVSFSIWTDIRRRRPLVTGDVAVLFVIMVVYLALEFMVSD
jgi:hypothetical protein